MKKILCALLALVLCLSLTSPVFAETLTQGDMNGDGEKNSTDAVYLLYHVLFGKDRYPVTQPFDYDYSGKYASGDAIYLLYNVLFGADRYPLGYGHVADVTNIREQLEAIPKVDPSMSVDELRQICVRFMQLSVSFQWVPDRDFSYSDEDVKTFYRGKLEGGLPYINTASGNLYRWLEYYDPETGITDCSVIENTPSLFGNACSGAAGWAWSRVINSAQISWTSHLNVANGLVKLGPYEYDTTQEKIWEDRDGGRYYFYNPKTVCKRNGYQVMYESYALGLPADCYSSGGHVVMAAEVPVVVRNPDGTINGDESYVVIAEQGLYNTGEHHTRYTSDGTSYQIRGNDRIKFTFKHLYTEGYLPHTFKEFVGLDPVEPATASIPLEEGDTTVDNLLKGNLTSTYPISDVFYTIYDEYGEEVVSKTYRMARHYYKSFAMSKIFDAELLRRYSISGDYRIKITTQLATGHLITLFEGALVP